MQFTYNFALLFLGIIVIIELLVFNFVKDKKIRFICLCALGILTMSAILIGTIITKMWKLTIFMSVLLIGYIISLSYIWFKLLRKK